MSDDDRGGSDLEAQVAELATTLEELQRQIEPARRPPLVPPRPSMDELRRFSSEVAIPGLILLLETNVRALKLLQRTIRLTDDRRRAGDQASAVSEQVSDLGVTALARLEDALADVQSALEGQPDDAEARDLLAEARALREDIEAQLRADGTDREEARRGPEVDVEAELQSIKSQVEDDDSADET